MWMFTISFSCLIAVARTLGQCGIEAVKENILPHEGCCGSGVVDVPHQTEAVSSIWTSLRVRVRKSFGIFFVACLC